MLRVNRPLQRDGVGSNWWKWIVGIAFVVLAASAATAVTRPASWKALISAQFPEGEWVDAETLSQWIGSRPPERLVILDVREPEEYAVSHLRGALSVDPSHPDVEGLSIPPASTVVVYCSIGYRSAAIVDDLKNAGVDEVYNLEGGLFEWANQGRAVYREEKPVHEVHPFNRWWGLLLKSELRGRPPAYDRRAGE